MRCALFDSFRLACVLFSALLHLFVIVLYKSQLLSAGLEIKEVLSRKIGTSAVACAVKSKDMYGRDVAKCSLPGTGDLGQWLVSNGYAVAYRCASLLGGSFCLHHF